MEAEREVRALLNRMAEEFRCAYTAPPPGQRPGESGVRTAGDPDFAAGRPSHLLIDVALVPQVADSADTGVLIVIEQDIGLKDFIDKGVRLGSHINAEILNTIFMPFTPLHDGAVIIKGGRIEAAACFLPISQDADLAREFGTRHRAAVGITEITDAIALIVSEETGHISVAKMGRLQRDLNEERVKEVLAGAFRKIHRPRKILPLK